MIAETAYLDTTAKSTTMVATDQSTDFTNCENKSETLNVVSNGFSFKSTSNSKLNETESELDLENVETNEDVTDYCRPKKLQKSLTGNNNLINQQQTNSVFGQIDSDFNLKTTAANKSTSNQFLKTNNKNQLTNNQNNDNDLNNQQTSGTSRRKQNLIDNEYEDNYDSSAAKDNSPKVPPLRIVISSTSGPTGRNSKDLNQTNTNDHSSVNYVVSTAVDSQVTSSSSFSNSQNDKKETKPENFYLTRSSNQQSTMPTSNSSSSNAVGRITRSQRAALNHHLLNDDSQTRYSSPDELAGEYNNETSELYAANSQNLKESNKENKDLRRKGKGRRQQLNVANSSASTSPSLNNATSAGQQSSLDSDPSASLDEQMDEQSMINMPTNSRDFQMPAYNCLNLYQNIRKQVEKRRQTMCDALNSKSKTSPKAPQGFKSYLMTTGNYLLESRNESTRNVNPNLTIEQIEIPESLKKLNNVDDLIDLFKEQELEREKVRVQHLVEKEKIKLSIEQEVLRVHGRASLAMANQSIPLSFTTLLKDEEIYNNMDENEHPLNNNNLEMTNQQKENTTKNEYSRATYSCSLNNQLADLYTLTGKSEGKLKIKVFKCFKMIINFLLFNSVKQKILVLGIDTVVVCYIAGYKM